MRSYSLLCCLALAACASQPPLPPSVQHLQQTTQAGNEIPPIVLHNLSLPEPQAATKVETYSVVVNNVPAQEILFALARDAKINLDIHPGIDGKVTLNALQQTLPQILNRISKQVDMRYELEHGNLTVMPDTPYLHHYKIDYVNMSRDMESSIQNNMQVSNANVTNHQANHSSVSIKDSSKNRFWDTLIQNIKDILRETDKILPDGNSETIVQQNHASNGQTVVNTHTKKHSETNIKPVNIEQDDTTITRRSTFREAASVIANPENGLITVRATGKQHEKIQEFVDQILSTARRQVMIETTIVEVRLNNEYHQGINWSALIGNHFKLLQNGDGNFGNGTLGVLSSVGNVKHQLSLLESFGKVRVLSSPKLSVLNNQTAMMRVVDNLVYFTVKADTISNQNSATITTYTTTPNTLPVGFTMSVTPQISDRDEVLLNIKPSISRLIQYVPDPNPNLLNVKYLGVPEIQTREMESLMRLENNQIAVMGGLMQDRASGSTAGIPGTSNLPLGKELLTQQNNSNEKTELVIFLRPVIINQASLAGDYQAQHELLPNQEFFKRHEKM